MILLIIKDNKSIIKNYINSSFKYKNLDITLINNKYYIYLRNDYYFTDGLKVKALEYKHYVIEIKDKYYNLELFVYDHDDGIDSFKLYENTNFVLANDNRANIICHDEYLKDFYLIYKNNQLTSNYDLLVNNKIYDGSKLVDADVIEIIGIKIIYFEDFLYINNFNVNVLLKPYEIKQICYKYKTKQLTKYHRFNESVEELKLDDIDEFVKPNKPSNSFKTIIPSIFMNLAMIVVSFSNANNTNMFLTLLVPISSLVSTILIPLMFIMIERSKYKHEYVKVKNDYLSYLDEYNTLQLTKIKSYINNITSNLYCVNNDNNKLFNIDYKSYNYLNLLIGYRPFDIDIKYKNTDDIEINNKISTIINNIKQIDNYPLIYKIENINTISCKSIDVIQVYLYILYALAYSHNFEDLNIAVYSKERCCFDLIYNLPHLFIDGYRLTLTYKKQLIELDQRHLDKDVVLLMLDDEDYAFSNNKIKVVYITSSDNVYKYSSSRIVFGKNKATLYTNSNTVDFTYYPSFIDYPKRFKELGMFNTNKDSNKNIDFKYIFNEDIEYYYKNNDHLLQASFAYYQDEILYFDLHESKNGPHGLIGGSTGSGKSELIVSLLLSLCIRYAPDYLNIAIIDYKGGGLKESLSYNNVLLPHVVASISNLEDGNMERFIIALKNECLYRQRCFKQLSNNCNSSIMNIDDYLANVVEGHEKIGHLVVVVDEFAELKKQNPEFIKELISISRIGRSLGIHLILATQKPAGVIDDEIWSNSRFKIALKTFEEKDSNDLIRSKDAAYLSKAGSFILRVDENLIHANSIYTKNDVNGNDPYCVTLLNENLLLSAKLKYQDHKITSAAEYYCKKIINTCKALNITSRILEFNKPENKYRMSYGVIGSLVLGEIDDYINGKKGVLKYNLNDDLLICSSRKNEINAILNTYIDNQKEVICISSKQYLNPYITDSILYQDDEDIMFIFNYLLSNRNIDTTLIIEDINVLLSYNEVYLNLLIKLFKQKHDLNIIVLCNTSQLNIRLLNLFNNKVLINTYNQNDIVNLFSIRSKYKGDSFYMKDDVLSFVPIRIEDLINTHSGDKHYVKHIPKYIKPEIIDDKYLIGYEVDSRQKVYVKGDVKVYSYNQEFLTVYENAYKDLECHLYNNQTNIKNKNVLWLGSGIYDQRLFIYSKADDLMQEQGLLCVNNTKTIIRGLSYGGNNDEI